MGCDGFTEAATAHEYQAVCQARDDTGQPQHAMCKAECDGRYGQCKPANGREGDGLKVCIDQSPHEIAAIGEFLGDRHDENRPRDSTQNPKSAQRGR